MSISKALKWFNRHGLSSFSLALLLGACAFADFMARLRMDIFSRQFAIMDERTIRDMTVIDFIHAQYWVVIAYAAVFLACLLWLEFRAASRWTVCVAFILLALPALAYGRACSHIANKLIL